MVNAQGLVKYRLCPVNSLHWRTVFSVVYVWKEEFNSELSSVLNTTLALFQHLVQGYMYIKAWLIYLFDELSPSKIGLTAQLIII